MYEKNMDRDITFDLMKGVAIIAMLCGHCIIPQTLHHFIYMWHMPLFFIVSGYFYRTKPFKDFWHGTYRSLLVPYAFTCFVAFILAFVLNLENYQKIIYGTFGISSAWLGSNAVVGYGGNGPLWFLMALFWCRFIYDTLQRFISNKYLLGGGVAGISIFGAFIGNKYYIPFYLAHGMIATLFYYVGHLSHKYSINKLSFKHWHLLLLGAFIIAGMKVGEPYFFALYFPNFIINTFAAISTTGAIYFISRKLKNTQILCFLSNVGRLSLLLLCIHGIDYILKGTNTFVYTLCSQNGRVANLIYDIMLIAMPVIATSIFARVVFVRKIFNIK